MMTMEIGCFGKLPLSPEFIRVNASGAGLRTLDQWFQEGIQYARTRTGKTWKQDFLQTDTWNFVFVPPAGTEMLIGVASPNQDKAGRTFPFLLFLRIEKAQWEESLHLAPVVCNEFLSMARDLAETGWEATDLTTFREKIQNFPANGFANLEIVQEGYEEYLRLSKVDDILEAIDDGIAPAVEKDPSKIFRKYLDRIGQESEVHVEQGIWVPLFTEEMTSPYDIVFWIDLVSKVFDKQETCSTLFWVTKPKVGVPYVFLVSTPPSPKILADLVRLSLKHRHAMVTPERTNPKMSSHGHGDSQQDDITVREGVDGSLAALLDSISHGKGLSTRR